MVGDAKNQERRMRRAKGEELASIVKKTRGETEWKGVSNRKSTKVGEH